MMRSLIQIVIILLALPLGHFANAGVMISMSGVSSGLGSGTSSDPFVLHAGDSVDISVNLSGLGEPSNPTELEYLAMTLTFDQPFSSISSLAPGAIVPGTADPYFNAAAGVIAATGTGFVTAYYDAFADSPSIASIDSNGVFVSFTFTAPLLSDDTDFAFTIDSADYFVLDPGVADKGDPLYIRVLRDANTVPEPASGVILGTLIACAGTYGWRKRTSKQPA